jgi:hypothetical protein
MASNGALAERNERVKYARSIGVEKPHMLKREPLETAIAEAEAVLAAKKAERAAAKEDDPFDEIDPTREGDHLTEDVLPEVVTVADGVSLRESIREAWLIDSVTALKAMFRQAGFNDIDGVRMVISTGFPQGNVRKVIGQCHHADFNEGVAHIFINPTQDDSVKVLGIVAHEMVHAMGRKGHGKEFSEVARAIGLTGAGGASGKGFTATVIHDDSMAAYTSIADELGPYPHTKVNLADGGVKKQTTRMLKVECFGKVVDPDTGEDVRRGCELAGEDGKGYIIRLTKKWAEVGLPTCPCGGEMELDEKGNDGE